MVVQTLVMSCCRQREEATEVQIVCLMPGNGILFNGTASNEPTEQPSENQFVWSVPAFCRDARCSVRRTVGKRNRNIGQND